MSNKLSLLVNFVGVDKMSGSLRNIMALGKKGSRSLNELRGEGRKLGAQLRDVRRQIAGASGNVSDLVNRERALEAAIEDTNRQLERRKKLNSIEGDRRAMVARGEAMQARGRENMVQGASLLAPIAFATKAGMDYEKQLALLAQKTDMSEDQTKAFGRSILFAARATRQMPDTMIGAADFLSSKGGMSTNQLQAMLPVLGRFGTAWDANVGDAAKAAHANMLSLKVSVSDTARALDIMGMAGKEGGFEVRDMAQHFPILTAGLATLKADGLPAVASLSSALQVLEAKTGDGATAANDLANMMRFTQTAQGQKNFKKFGIDIVAELEKAAKEGADPLERIAQLTRKATGGDDAKIAQLFTDTQASRAALNLSTSIDRYREIRDKAFAAQGITAQEFARMSKTGAANWEAMKGSLAGLSASLGTHLLPLVTAGFNKITLLVNRVADWADANPKTAATVMKVVAGLALFKLGLGAAQYLLGSMFGPLAQVIALYRKFLIVGSLAKLFPNLAMGMRLVGLALRFMLGPVGLVIAGLALLGVAVWQNWDKIKAAFAAGKAWLANFGSNMLSVGKDIVLGLARGITGAASAVWNALKGVVTGGIQRVNKLLDRNSPSRVFMAIGSDTSEGMAIGIDRGRKGVLNAAGRLASGAATAGALAMSPTVAAAAPAGQAGGSGAASGQAPLIGELHIHQQPGEDAEALADRVIRELQRKAGIAARSTYEDR